MMPANLLAQRFLERHPEAAVEVLAGLPPRQLAEALEELDASTLVNVVQRLPVQTVAHCLNHFSLDRVAALLGAMQLRNAVDILRRSGAPERERYLAALPPHTAVAMSAGLERVQDNVAAHMDSRVRSFSVDLTVERALLKLEQDTNEAICHIYVTDAHSRFAGILPLRLVFASHSHLRLGSLPIQTITALPEAARISSVIAHPDWQRFPQLPVVDAGGHFVGVLRRERLVEHSAGARPVTGGALGMGLALIEGYALASAVLLELLMNGGGRRR